MELENYQEEKLTINLVWANLFAILSMVPIALVYGLPFYLLWSEKFHVTRMKQLLPLPDGVNPVLSSFCFVALFILGIVLHELIHGITWSIFTKNGFKSIKFGVLMKMLTPYCHCKEPLKVGQYLLGAIMPALLLGLLPAIIAIVIGNFALLVWGGVFTMLAAGDFLIIHLLRNEDKENFVMDHPSEAGCYVYRKVN